MRQGTGGRTPRVDVGLLWTGVKGSKPSFAVTFFADLNYSDAQNSGYHYNSCGGSLSAQQCKLERSPEFTPDVPRVEKTQVTHNGFIHPCLEESIEY